MIKLAKQDWDKFLRDNNPEVFTEEQINAWIESNRDLLVKAEGETLSAQDNQFVQDFRTEISHFTKVEVLRPNDDKLQKSLVHEIFYIREKQVDWDEEIIKSEDGEEFSFGTYRETSLNNKLGRTGNLIEKGKRGQLGEVREWKGGKYKKTAQGWVPVREGKENSTNKVKDLNIFSHKEGGYGATAIVNGNKVSIKLPKEFTSKVSSFEDKEVREKVKEMLLNMAGKEWENKVYQKERSKEHIDSIKRSIKQLEDRQKTHKLSEIESNALKNYKKDLDRALDSYKENNDNNGVVSDKELENKVKSEYYIQYKNKWGEIDQKPFVATSIEEAIEMAKEQKIGSDIGPSKIPDKTGREEKDQYIKEIESKKEGDKDDQLKGEEKAKLLKEVFESMDFLGINREDFSEMKKEHGGLKKLNEYLSEELSGRYKKGDKIEFDGITIHVGRDTSGGQDTLEYSAPEINNKKYWSLNKLKEIIKEHNEKK